MKALTRRLIALGATTSIAVAGAYLVEPWEGTKNQAYKDMVGIPTICAGYTIGVKMGDYKTDEECEKLLVKELTDFNTKMMKAVKVPLPENMEIAYTSLVWNIGIGAWNSSTIVKKLNAREYQAACEQILRWNKAGGKVVKGLDNRRKAEYKVCVGKDSGIEQALKELEEVNKEPLVNATESPETVQTAEPTQSAVSEEINVSAPIPPTVNITEEHSTSAAPVEKPCSIKLFGRCWKR